MYVYLNVTIVHCTTVTFKTVTKSNSDCEVCIAGRPPSASFHRAHLSHNGGDIVMLRLAEIQISNSALEIRRIQCFFKTHSLQYFFFRAIFLAKEKWQIIKFQIANKKFSCGPTVIQKGNIKMWIQP